MNRGDQVITNLKDDFCNLLNKKILKLFKCLILIMGGDVVCGNEDLYYIIMTNVLKVLLAFVVMKRENFSYQMYLCCYSCYDEIM